MGLYCSSTINTNNISSLQTISLINMFNFIDKLTPFAIIPYMVVALFIIIYFAYLQYLIRKEIRNMPSAIYKVDVNNLKKNLLIKSMVYNFILIISIIEFVANIVIETNLLIRPIIQPNHIDTHIHLSNSCSVEDMDLAILTLHSTFIYSRTRFVAIVLISEVPILMALFYVILRRMYLNVPYHKHIRKHIIYIVSQFVVKSVLVCIVPTYYIGVLLYLPFGLIDFVIYIFASQKFYALLKGMRNAASLHSTKCEYIEKKRIVKRFFFAQVVTTTIFSLLLILSLIEFITTSVQVITSCFISYITLGFIPTITLSDRVRGQMSHIGVLTQMGILFIVELMVTTLYLGMAVDIVVKLVRKRRRYNNSNFLLARPLLEKYRNRLLK